MSLSPFILTASATIEKVVEEIGIQSVAITIYTNGLGDPPVFSNYRELPETVAITIYTNGLGDNK